MTDVEMLEAIIKAKGVCRDVLDVKCTNCPLLQTDCTYDYDCVINAQAMLTKLKGGPIIDLTKPQILTEPVKCWVRDNENRPWAEGWLIGIATGSFTFRYVTVAGCPHNELPGVDDTLNNTKWKYCTLTDPYKPTRRMMTQEEVIAWACTEGAVGWQMREKSMKPWGCPSVVIGKGWLPKQYERRTVKQIAPNKYEYGEPIDFTIEVTE